jgi:uncharacterized protein (DUF58 family)
MKVFREEHRPGVVVLLDRRKSMQFGTQTRLKVTQAARAATCIAFSAQQSHSSVSAVVLEAKQKTPTLIREVNNKQATDELMRTACAPCPLVFSRSDVTNNSINSECAFSNAINILQETHLSGSTIYLLSDFIDLEEQHRSRLMQLAAHNNVHAIHIYDPAEKILPMAGLLRFHVDNYADNHVDNDDQDMAIDTSNMLIRKNYNNAAEQHFAKRKQLFNSLNITYTEYSTNDDAIETLFPVL